MDKKYLLAGSALLAAAIAAAAAVLFLFPYQPGMPPEADEAGSDLSGITQVIDANNKFAFDLYSELADHEEGNIFYSPYSMSAALAMAYEGAKGATADEMRSVLHLPADDILRPNFAAIYNGINKENNAYRLRTGNALWVQEDFLLLEDYMDRVGRYYGGKASNLDFVSETEKSRQAINSFIEQQTEGRIKDLIPAGYLDPATRLIITNAIYFKGTWEWEFDKAETREQDFRVSSGNIVKARMMHMDPDKARFNYADLDKLQVLELPYKGEKISMLILLPKQGEKYDPATGDMLSYDYTLGDIDLSYEAIEGYKARMHETKLSSIQIPKFDFDTKYFMKGALMSLGMQAAFTPDADFSGMTGRKDLFIDFVIHQAYVKVDETGTEAAAATAVGMQLTSVMPDNAFRADHPFLFIIQERETGNILFMGRLSDPSA